MEPFTGETLVVTVFEIKKSEVIKLIDGLKTSIYLYLIQFCCNEMNKTTDSIFYRKRAWISVSRCKLWNQSCVVVGWLLFLLKICNSLRLLHYVGDSWGSGWQTVWSSCCKFLSSFEHQQSNTHTLCFHVWIDGWWIDFVHWSGALWPI